MCVRASVRACHHGRNITTFDLPINAIFSDFSLSYSGRLYVCLGM